MHTVHAGYTLIAPLKEGDADAVSKLLVEMRAHPERLPFSEMASVHFATGAVLPAQPYGDEMLPASLMVATSFCGPSRAHEDELVRIGGTGLRELFSHCEGFPDQCTDAQLGDYIRDHREADTFYSGMQHLTRAEVLAQNELRTAIETYVDDHQPLTGAAVDIRCDIQQFVSTQPKLAWALRPWAREPGWWLALYWRSVLLGAIVVPFLAALLIASIVHIFVHNATLGLVVSCGWLALIVSLLVLVGLIAGVRNAEQQQTFVAGRQPDEHVRSLAATQNNPVINEMTVVGPVKEGAARPLFLRIALWVVARLAEGVPGLREAINIPTVATARWVAIDRGRRLVFISNFTHAAEPYVRDFIDIRDGAKRINLSFGFGRGYPITEWIIMGGAVVDPNGFIDVVHANMRHTELWYCPYNNLSIDNIKLNRLIREGLPGTCTEEQAKKWLQLL